MKHQPPSTSSFAKPTRLASLIVAAGLSFGIVVAEAPTQAVAAPSATVAAVAAPAKKNVAISTKFQVNTTGAATAIRFYKTKSNKGKHVGYLFDASGNKLATVKFRKEKKKGWVKAKFATPVQLAAGQVYTGAVSKTSAAVSTASTLAAKTATVSSLSKLSAGKTVWASAKRKRNTSTVQVQVTPPTTTTTTPAATTASGSAGWTVTASTVGLAAVGKTCDSLPAYTGSTNVPAGTTISGKKITSQLNLSAGNITIDSSCIQPTSVAKGTAVLSTSDANNKPTSGTVTISNSEISGTKLSTDTAAWATGFIGIANLKSNYVHHLGSGLALMNTGTSLNATVERNYVTDLLATGNPATTGNHSDAFTVRDFSNAGNANRQALIANNRFDCDSSSATGAFFIQAWAGRIDNVTLQGNLLEGGGYQLALEANNNGYTNVKAVDNRFSGTGYGATYRTGGPGWATWTDNYIYNAGATDAKGTAASKP